ncbi:recombinase family protein [Amycolatopsis sp. SID8362]|uniref:recombinase family protein n=1 Tax=Amycolatopsis sp. SID8362 TaxID=2690346 RepID=UPI002814B8A8|nr:recombinase family protein [Amycolatopsis sp. SID8362]
MREGWNIGKPCYGYKAKTFRHPNPAKAAKGLTKTRLEPDGPCGQTVTQIASWAYYDHLGRDAIANLLNLDLEKHRPPVPPGAVRARGVWSRSSVYDILRNPKYTGYQVYNRRATRSRRGKVNDPVKWVWSLEPAHEPLIPKWMYDELAARRQAKKGSRTGGERNVHPQTKRTYLFRGMVFCSCGRRMIGVPRHGRSYYLCRPSNTNRGRPDKYLGHEKALYFREDALLDAVSRFFADRVFGSDRRTILESELAGVDDQAARDREAEVQRLGKALGDLAKRQDSILQQAADGDPDDPFTKALRGRYNDLEKQRTELASALAELRQSGAAGPDGPTAADVGLIDALPYLALNLATAPEDLLRTLFEVTQLTIRIDAHGDRATLEITLPEDQLPEVSGAAERITEEMLSQGTPSGRPCEVAVRAPGEIPAAITPIALSDGLLIQVDVRLVMERRPRRSAR